MKPTTKQIGKAIKAVRIKFGISKKKFAKFFGTNNTGLAKIERRLGRRK